MRQRLNVNKQTRVCLVLHPGWAFGERVVSADSQFRAWAAGRAWLFLGPWRPAKEREEEGSEREKEPSSRGVYICRPELQKAVTSSVWTKSGAHSKLG